MSIVSNINRVDFEQVVSEGLVLVDFWAPWCGPCKMQLSVLEELALELKGNATIAKLNIDDAPEVAEQFGVQAIPTLLLFMDGKERRRFIGLQTKETLMAAIDGSL
ncbi:MAG: thioredoxin [Syntrophaceae bacterium]|nr:thioredoxin [Syntrophaceae bacterium]